MTKLTGEQEPNHKNKTQTRAHTHTPTLNPPPPPPPPITGDLFFPRFVSFIHQRICVCVFDYYVTVVAVIKNIVSFFFYVFVFFVLVLRVCVCVCVLGWEGEGNYHKSSVLLFLPKKCARYFFYTCRMNGWRGRGGVATIFETQRRRKKNTQRAKRGKERRRRRRERGNENKKENDKRKMEEEMTRQRRKAHDGGFSLSLSLSLNLLSFLVFLSRSVCPPRRSSVLLHLLLRFLFSFPFVVQAMTKGSSSEKPRMTGESSSSSV